MLYKSILASLVFCALGGTVLPAQSTEMPPKIRSIAETEGGLLLAGTEEKGVFVSRDHGVTWTSAGFADKDVGGVTFGSPTLWFAAYRSFSGGGLSLSTDAGARWEHVGPSKKVQAMALVRSGPDWRVVMGTVGGGPGTLDASGKWHGGAGLSCSTIKAVAALQDGTLFAGGDCGLLLSSGDGEKWTKTAEALGKADVRSIAAAEVPTSSWVFAGTSNGVYATNDRGSSWRTMNNGLENLSVRSVSVDSTGTVWAATDGGGFARLPGKNRWVKLETPMNTRSIVATAGGAVFVQFEDLRTMRYERKQLVQKAAALLQAMSPTVSPPPPAAPRMNNNDIVQMAVARLSSGVIATSIRQAPVNSFDVTFAGLKELKAAGVGDTVVVAMVTTSPGWSTMANDDVIQLIAAGISEPITIATVRRTAKKNFDLGPQGLIALKRASVSDGVIAAMQERPIPAAARQARESTAVSAPLPPAPPPPPQNPCAGIEVMGLYKVDMRPAMPLIVYQVKVRNGTSLTRIVTVGWTDLYGQEKATQGQVAPGAIATFELGPQQPVERQPINLRLRACE